MLSHGGLAITPRENLIHLYGMIGTHSVGNRSSIYDIKASETFTFDKEPIFIISNVDYNKVHLEKHILKMRKKKSFFKKALSKMLRLIGK